MQNYRIDTNEQGKELVEHGDVFFPIAGYDEYFSLFVNQEVPWHWHDEIELIVVISGATKLETLNDSIIVYEGQGLFINSNVFHRMTKISTQDCHIINFVLDMTFLSGREDTKIHTTYLGPLSRNSDYPYYVFKDTTLWQKDIICNISIALESYKQKDTGYELFIKSKLLESLLKLIINEPSIIEENHIKTDRELRIETIIKYIHNNYQEDLNVKALAAIANISESECYRLFKDQLHTTPNNYLIHHRLTQAASKLLTSTDSIINIMYDVGFSSHSYFSKKFKSVYNLSPKEYRKKYQKN